MRWVGLAEVGAGVFLFGAIVRLIFYQVTARYVFGEPEAWIEELCTCAFIWLVFLGARAACVSKRIIPNLIVRSAQFSPFPRFS